MTTATFHDLLLSEAAKKYLADKRSAKQRIIERTLHHPQSGLTPKIRMIVSPWFADEHGIMTRVVKAAE
jgi:hypothetical protein